MKRWTEIESSGGELRDIYNNLARGQAMAPRDVEELAVFLDHMVEFLGSGVPVADLEERLVQCEDMLRARLGSFGAGRSTR